MEKIVYESEFFSVKDTLFCGQLFRFKLNPVLSRARGAESYDVFSADKRCLAYNDGEKAVIECEEKDADYFYNYFDLERDYSAIFKAAESFGGIIKTAAQRGKGIRILNQDVTETLFSFIVSQNNNIPRIKAIIEKLCAGAGEEKEFSGEKYFAFPTPYALSLKDEEFFKGIGLGYRAAYIKNLADGFDKTIKAEELKHLSDEELRKYLLSVYGVGRKVADCVSLFAFHRSGSFPVDTWIEKIYKEDFGGTLNDREKIACELAEKFGENSGYFQQYLFHYKRGLKK